MHQADSSLTSLSKNLNNEVYLIHDSSVSSFPNSSDTESIERRCKNRRSRNKLFYQHDTENEYISVTQDFCENSSNSITRSKLNNKSKSLYNTKLRNSKQTYETP